MPFAGGDQGVGLLAGMAPVDRYVAGQHDAGGVGVSRKLLAAPAHELVDVAVVVGEQDPLLHVAPIAARVVHEAAQRVVDAGGVEQRQRAWLALAMLPLPIRDLVAHGGELRRRKMAGEIGRGDAGARNLVGALEHIGVGDLLVADGDLNAGAILGD